MTEREAMMEWVDNFLSEPERVRLKGLQSRFQDLEAFDGERYERVKPEVIPEVQVKLEKIFGPVLMLGSGFRLNYNDEEPNSPVHVDVGWGTHALVIYLSSGPAELLTGTAFWSQDHKTITKVCHEKFNRCVIYRSNQPHSRWPFKAYGDCPENGRLIFVAFFTPIDEL